MHVSCECIWEEEFGAYLKVCVYMCTHRCVYVFVRGFLCDHAGKEHNAHAYVYLGHAYYHVCRRYMCVCVCTRVYKHVCACVVDGNGCVCM